MDTSGRHARKGFSYQDHVAVSLCIEFLVNPLLKEIWLETHEDILLFWGHAVPTVEFVQVKAIDQTSRWSVASICGNGILKDALVKKMLDQDRCSEDTLFRVVSSYDVNQDVSILKMTINSAERKSERNKELDLSKEIKKKLGDISSPNGRKVEDWVDRCWWQKKADHIMDLISSNKLALENALATFGKPILSDQRDEIYQKILKFCQDASTGDLTLDSECYKITRDQFIDWLGSTIDSLYAPSAGTQKLQDKLTKAKNVPSDYIQNAKQLKWDYVKNRLTSDFIQPSDLSSLTEVIHGELFKMKLALDNDELEEEQFHKLCMDKLRAIRESDKFKDKNVPEYFLSGFMYELTSKCIHRFRKIEV